MGRAWCFVFLDLFYFVYMNVFLACVCVYYMGAYDCGSQKRVLDPFELEL